jgi:hypothetical protein
MGAPGAYRNRPSGVAATGASRLSLRLPARSSADLACGETKRILNALFSLSLSSMFVTDRSLATNGEAC